MIGMKDGLDTYRGQFDQLAQEASAESSGLRALRKQAFGHFSALGFPTTRNEEWKYTPVSPIAKVAFQPAAKITGGLTRESVARDPFTTLQCGIRLVFVNGFFDEALSSIGILPAGVKVASLAQQLKNEKDMVGRHLGHYARSEVHPFVALNTALFRDGALVELAPGCVLEEPILVVFISLPEDRPMVSHPRNLYLLGAGSRATLIESYLSLGEGVHFTNGVSELVAAEGSSIEHYQLQRENEQSFHVATLQAIQKRNSRLFSHNVSFGGALARTDLNVVLDGEGTETDLGGLFVATGRQHVDHHTALDHAQPHCSSRELYKGILGDQAVGVFNGKILVRKDAQKTNAFQSNQNLLLSEGARINTKPQLEIYADDVRCKHGATVGPLSPEAMFYMRSRGISHAAAGDLLTYAFAGEVLQPMSWVTVRSRLEQALFQKLAKHRQDK